MSHPLLTSPIGRSLLKLAGPTTTLMVVQIAVAMVEVYFLGQLGTDTLAAVALVVPFIVLMLNMANGGMGGGVASALARALGAGRMQDARALVLHALVLGVGIAIAFTTLAWALGPFLFSKMGGQGPVLRLALTYSNLWFACSILAWPAAFLASLLRGAGDTLTPGRIGLLSSFVYISLAGVLALGVGDWPGIGVAGFAIASIVAPGVAMLLQVHAVWRGRLGFAPRLRGVRLERRLFLEILHVGGLGSITTIAANLTAALVTGLVGRFGTDALAGYGIGMRLEFMLAPIAFGIGSGLTTMVGVAAGAGAWRRAVRVAWFGGLIAFAGIGAFGWAVAMLPESWSRLFTSDPPVLAVSIAFITRVAPFYCLFGLGLTLNFASQGARRMKAPLAASLVRMLTASAGGWLSVEWLGLGLNGVFAAIAASLALYGGAVAGPLLFRPWARSRGD